jgi:hypothetical protein
MTILGKYELAEELGAGSMGTVYRARDTVLDREVALKTIRTGPSVEPEIKERFYREARACARLQHPHIVTIYDFGEVEDTAYISMELLVGEDLRKIIEAQRPFPVHSKIELIAQVGLALAHAHRSGVVHRDVKPSNIFILEDHHAKVLDFGIARLPASKLTVLGKVLGTPNYMAPEQILGNTCDPRSDLFSLAIVFFEFLTGVHPFRNAYIPRSIVGQPPQRLRDIDPALPESLDQLLEKALQKKPEDRFQTADEFSAALEKQISGLSTVVAGNQPHAEIPAGRALAPATGTDVPTATLEQTAEWRASEFFRLMQDCDSAVEAKVLPEARRVLEEMKRLATIDARFSIAVQEYERQVGGLGEALQRQERSRAPAPSVTPPAARPVETAIGGSASPGRQSPPSSSAADVTRLFSLGGEKPAATSVAQESGSFTDADLRIGGLSDQVPIHRASTPVPLATSPAIGKVNALDRLTAAALTSLRQPASLKVVAIVGCCAVLLLLVVLAIRLLSTPRYPLLPAVGRAAVTETTSLYAGPSSAKKRLAVLQKGTRVNVVRPPQSSNPSWMDVQSIGEKPGPHGYVHTTALGGWSTFGLIQMFDPGDSADLATRTEYLNILRSGVVELGTADQSNGWLEIARQEIMVARAKKAAGATSDELRDELAKAHGALAKASSNQSLAEQVKTREQELALLESPPEPPPAAPSQPPSFNAAADLQAARDDYHLGQYRRAVQRLRYILAVDRHNNGARELLKTVQEAQREEAAASGVAR